MDRNLGNKIVAEWLRKTHASVEVHSKHFNDRCPDHIWIPHCSERDWIIVSPDKRIEVEVLNKAAIVASRAKVFLLASKGLRGEELGSILVVCRRRILEMASQKPGPFVVRISKRAEISKPRFFSPDEQKEILIKAGWDSLKQP